MSTMPTTAARTPYSAKGVRYVDQGTIVTAVWVSDPAVDPAEALDKILHTDLPYEVEVIAEATRFYKREGASFSGWIISQPSNGNYNTEPIPNKRQAAAALREWVKGYFEDRRARKGGK